MQVSNSNSILPADFVGVREQIEIIGQMSTQTKRQFIKQLTPLHRQFRDDTASQ